MKQDINKKYSIESDNTQFTVIEKSIIKEGKNAGDIFEKPIAYCTSLNYAFKFLLDRTVKTSKAINDLEQVLKEVRKIKADIDEVLKPLKGEK